jgi:NADH:ubiquinone oxidoreductase subunit 3 (subunit A)
MMDIIIKILLFFGVFYGAIAITAFVSKKIREKEDKDKKDKKQE